MTMKNPCHPGRIVKEAITGGLGLTVTAAAQGLGVSRKTLSAIVNERAAITPEMALHLEKGIGSTAEAWLRMQVAYDLAQALKTASKIKIRKLEPAA
jgi:addiction module HigA family antidote